MIKDENNFKNQFNGSFKGIMNWSQLDDLWATLKQNNQAVWFIYAVGETPPKKAVTEQELQVFISQLTELLKNDHGENYCGLVYVDDIKVPTIIKIYDPNNLGSSCGSAGYRILPGWIISHTKPDDLKVFFPPANNRRRWWRKLFS